MVYILKEIIGNLDESSSDNIREYLIQFMQCGCGDLHGDVMKYVVSASV